MLRMWEDDTDPAIPSRTLPPKRQERENPGMPTPSIGRGGCCHPSSRGAGFSNRFGLICKCIENDLILTCHLW